jgi:RNA polymerase sigma-70 factor, ECF subfamily
MARPGPESSSVSPPASPVGEAPSFEAVYEAHFDFVWRSLRRLGVSESGAEDAVQEVFLVVHRRLGEFEARSSVKTWLFGIARKIASRYRRARDRRPETGGTPALETLRDRAQHGSDESLARAQALVLLDTLLDELDEEKREVFVLAELEQMTMPEIGQALGLNVNTAYTRLRAARRDFERAAARERARAARRAG